MPFKKFKAGRQLYWQNLKDGHKR